LPLFCAIALASVTAQPAAKTKNNAARMYRSFSDANCRSSNGEYTPKPATRKAKNAITIAKQQKNPAAGWA
jgi:hypothetical protein